jgi:hypothetical protein
MLSSTVRSSTGPNPSDLAVRAAASYGIKRTWSPVNIAVRKIFGDNFREILSVPIMSMAKEGFAEWVD